MKRAAVPSILVAVVLLALGVTAEAQQPTKVPRIGYLSGSSISANPPWREAFRQGPRDLGSRKEKALSSNGDLRRERLIGCLRYWSLHRSIFPSWCVSR